MSHAADRRPPKTDAVSCTAAIIVAATLIVAAGSVIADAQPAPPSTSPQRANPEVFAPDAISTGNVYRGSFTPDGNTLYFFKRIGDEGEHYRIFRSRRLADSAAGTPPTWSTPRVVDLGGDHSDLYPAIAPDGSFMVFSSYRPAPGDDEPGRNANLWLAPAGDDGWGEPELLPVSTFANYDVKPLITAEGLLHFESTTPDWQTTTSMVARWNRETFVDAHPWEVLERWRSWRDDLHVWGGIPSPDNGLVLLEVSPVDRQSNRPGPAEHWVSFRTVGGWTEPRPVPAMNAGGGGNFAFWDPSGENVFFVRDFARFLRISATAAFAELRSRPTGATGEQVPAARAPGIRYLLAPAWTCR